MAPHQLLSGQSPWGRVERRTITLRSALFVGVWGSVWWGRAVGVLTTVRGWCTVSFVMVIPSGVAGEHRIRLGRRVCG